jgi:hypothetical protein
MRILKRPAIPDNQALPKPLLADSKRLQRVRVINPQLLPEIAAAHSESGSESTPFSQPQRFHSLNVFTASTLSLVTHFHGCVPLIASRQSPHGAWSSTQTNRPSRSRSAIDSIMEIVSPEHPM